MITTLCLSVTTDDYEAVWIEINCDPTKNILCAVIYRHPSKVDHFDEYLFGIIDKITRENKSSIYGRYQYKFTKF